MTILYTIIARGKDATILVEVADSDIKGGNIKDIFQQMLQYFCDNPSLAINDGERKTFTGIQCKTTTSHNNNGTSPSLSKTGSSSKIIKKQQHQQTKSKTPTTTAPSASLLSGSSSSSQTKGDTNSNDFFSYWMEACTSAMFENECMDPSTNDGSSTITSLTSYAPYVAYETDEYFIHVYYKDAIYYTCLSDDPDPRDYKVSYAYLEMLQKDFSRMFRTIRINITRSNGLDRAFSPTVRSIVHYHNVHHNEIRSNDKTRLLMAQINDMKSILGRNIKLMIQRKQTIDQLHTKSTELESQVQVFRKRARQNLREQKYQYYSKSIVLCLIVLVCIYIGAAIPCGLTFQRCKITFNDSGRIRQRRRTKRIRHS